MNTELLDLENASTLSEVFKQLGNPNRLRLFLFLCHHEACVKDLSLAMDMTSPALSHHLRLLKSAKLIESHRKGKEMYYHATNSDVAQSLHHMIEHIEKITCPN